MYPLSSPHPPILHHHRPLKCKIFQVENPKKKQHFSFMPREVIPTLARSLSFSNFPTDYLAVSPVMPHTLSQIHVKISLLLRHLSLSLFPSSAPHFSAFSLSRMSQHVAEHLYFT